MKHAILPALFCALVLAPSAAAAEAAEELGRQIADSMQSQVPVQLDRGTMVEVKSQGGTLTIKYKFQTASGPEEAEKRTFAAGMCAHRGTISSLTEVGGTVVAILEFTDRTIITSLGRADCKPPATVRALTRQELQVYLSSLKFPIRISDTSTITGGRLGQGLEVILTVEENFSRAEAERAKGSPQTARWIAQQQKAICGIAPVRLQLEGGAIFIHRHQAQGFVIADVRVDKDICGI